MPLTPGKPVTPTSVVEEQWVTGWSSTTGTAAVGTAETVVVTVPSATFKAGSAYRLTVSGGYVCSTTGVDTLWRVRKGTTTAGTEVIQWPRPPTSGSTLAKDLPLSPRYLVIGGADVTTTLVLTLQSSAAGTSLHAATALYPRGVDIHYVGASSLWPNAVVLS